MMLLLLVCEPVLRAWTIDAALGARLLSPHPETSLLAAGVVGALVLVRVVVYGVGPGWLAWWLVREATR
jgi:hypothetical protein